MRPEKMTLGPLFIDTQNKLVTKKGTRIKLRKKEYELLEFLAINKNKVINRHTILEYVWNYSSRSETNTLEVHVTALRRKIKEGLSPTIATVHGLGYTLKDALPALPDDQNLFGRAAKIG